MSKDPAMLFYPSDFLTGTMFMSNEQVGIYMRLLCSQHQHGGSIDKDNFNALVKSDDKLIRSKFIEDKNGFYNERLLEEMMKRERKTSNLSEAMKSSWAKRKSEKQATSKPVASENINRNKNRVKNKGQKKNRAKKIPSWDELKKYLLEDKNKTLVDYELLKDWYDAAVEAGGKDGNDKVIINWKSKILRISGYEKYRLSKPKQKESLEYDQKM